jgi:L-ascorbate metabolism protein UlaG (beta-lactamase superfamily)
VAQFELCMWLAGQGLDKLQPMNLGGRIEHGGIRYAMVQAFHSAGVVKDGVPVALGDPGGFVIEGKGTAVYCAGDTAIFSDMALIQRIYRPKVGFLPIGDRFTMGPETATIACNELLDLDLVVPVHWGTFDLLSGRPEDFKARVTRGRVHIATPGEPFGL